jgi:predicted ATPase
VTDALPAGTVTFLFTDVEGSTRLLDELGAERYAAALGRHHAVIRGALVEHHGVEVDTQGDAFFCAFASPDDAVACSAAVQLGLVGGPIRVRIGVHTGEALVVDRHYIGIDVHRAARIGACGHGGQVLISPSTAELLERGAFQLTELGAHRLKDLAAPVILYQLGADEFPPLEALYATNLPIPATPFLGREDEVRELVGLASDPGVRLVTLTGPGGTGKTRLALQAAAELSGAFAGGVWWCPLAPLREGALVASALADVLGVEEEPDQSLTSAIADTLRSKRVLLLLDNCEHVLKAVAELVSQILASCPGVLVLTTSREPVDVSGEQVFSVQPLASADAVTLFDARARAAGASVEALEDREAIGALCHRLDNLPLAVELAAARTVALSPAALLERLSSRLDVLKGPRDADERQRTLRATISWSYDLLEGGEQVVFGAMSVFAGGASLEAVERVCGAELDELLSLVQKSLVRHAVGDGSESRYWMLETIREFANERLVESAEIDAYGDRHAAWYASRAGKARDHLVGPGSNDWLAELERDRENLRSALEWALGRVAAHDGASAVDRRDESVTLAVVLGSLHSLHGRHAEAEAAVRRALDLAPSAVDAAALLEGLSVALRRQRRSVEGLDALVEAERRLESSGERDAAWWATWIDVKLEQANYFYFEAELDELASVIAELRPVVDERGSPVQRLDLLHVLAQDAYRKERYALSEETEELVRDIYRRSLGLEDDYAGFTLGFCLNWRGKFDEAEGYLLQTLDSARMRGDVIVEIRCLVYALVARRRQNDVEGARALLGELEGIDDLLGYQGLTTACAAWVALRDGDLDAAWEHGEAALADWAGERGRGGPTVFQWSARFPLLAVAVERGRTNAAFAHAREMLHESQQPLADDVREPLNRAVREQSILDLEEALERAHAAGYA